MEDILAIINPKQKHLNVTQLSFFQLVYVWCFVCVFWILFKYQLNHTKFLGWTQPTNIFFRMVQLQLTLYAQMGSSFWFDTIILG